MNPKEILRSLLPYGLVASRHRKFRLSRLGLPNSREIETAVETCRYDLWPEFLRNAKEPWTLVDVGANVGDFVAAAAKLRPFQSVYAMEPQPSCQAELAATLQHLPNAKQIPAAVGRTEGSLELHVTANSRMTSGLRPEKGIHSAYSNGDFSIAETLTVPTITLDSAIPHEVTVGLLKLDVQGFEIEVLAGAVSTLQRTRSILIEVNYIRHYENGAVFDDIYEELRQSGFRLYGISEPFGSTSNQPLWADAVFVNQNS